ncbi:MAG: MurR/RpiR family transcriptional regulator [Deltaproteobacteria bacterium]|nr:MurR/RpiR family transcriptional regulator [Deltaproteobacteria bacterium]
MLDFEILLSEKRPPLTKIQEKALTYIMDNYEEAIFLTASRLAQRAGVSEATMVRLAQALGFNGFPSMQRTLRREFQDRLSTVSRLEKTVKRARDEGDILVKVFQEDLRNLSQSLRDLSEDTFRHAVKEMAGAARVYVIGLNQAHAPALVLANYLSLIKKGVHLLEPGYGDIWSRIYDLASDDLVIGISISRYTRLTVDVLAYARARGSKVGAISDSLLSPLARHADWVLPVRCRLDSYICSFTAVMSLVNALITAMSVQNPRETLKALKDREALWMSKGVYVSPLPNGTGK